MEYFLRRKLISAHSEIPQFSQWKLVGDAAKHQAVQKFQTFPQNPHQIDYQQESRIFVISVEKNRYVTDNFLGFKHRRHDKTIGDVNKQN